MSWKDEPATLNQRMAIERMYKRLGWDTRGIRDMTKADAADAFARCHGAFDEKDQRLDLRDPFEPYNDSEYGAYKQA